MKIKILIVSDSHGNFVNLRKAAELEYPFDYLVHCGDGIADIARVELPGGIIFIKVAGNIDSNITPGTEKTETVTISGMRVMVTHGDLYHAHNGNAGIISEALDRGAEVVFYGHTHKKFMSGSRPVLFNPGPLSNGSYGIAYINSTIELYHKKLLD